MLQFYSCTIFTNFITLLTFLHYFSFSSFVFLYFSTTFNEKSPALEVAVRAAVSNIVVEVVANKVMEQIKAKCDTHLSKSKLVKLKQEVVLIVQNLFRPL